MKVEKYFLQATKLALIESSKKNWLHAAIGIRADGAIVCARNGEQNLPMPSAHAEARLCRKLGKNAPLVIVVRVNKQGEWKMSKPCAKCEKALRLMGVKKVMWSVGNSESEYDSMNLS